jgi:hypothetical protein
MQSLPIDERGYVVPWFVDWVDGKPEFRAMNRDKWVRAIKLRLCWVCGERMGQFLTFVAGPMCGINRTSSEPPSHIGCARWSARNCPFLNNPNASRRRDDDVNELSKSIGGFAVTRNPGVTLLWTTKDFTVFPDGKGGALICMGEPTNVEWYKCGKLATRADVIASIESGIPVLEHAASLQDGGLQHLADQRARFWPHLPKE